MARKLGPIRAAAYRWLGLPTTLATGGDHLHQHSGSRPAGQHVTEQSVLGLSAAYACTRLISEAVGGLPLKVYERTKDGREYADHHPIAYTLSKSPNSSSTPTQFWSAITSSMLLWGNGFALIQRVGPRIAGLEFVHPAKVKGVTNAAGHLTHYEIQRTSTEARKVALVDMLHIPAFGIDGQWGISAIAYGAPVFASGQAGAAQANSTFEKGLAPTVAVKMDHWLKKEQRDEMRERMAAINGAINAGRTPLLEGGMDMKAVGINPRDAQLLESRGFSVEEICRWFGVDPSMIGHGAAVSNWGTGLEQKMIGFLTFTLQPLLRRIEQAINKYLIQSDTYYAEFIIEGLLRADSAGRSTLYKSLVDSGIMTRDEVRDKENLPRMGGNSAKQTIQMGFTTLENIGVEQDEH